jgi:hypothetical protein
MKIQIITGRVEWPVRADYSLQVDEPAKEIRIIDADLGNMSVTNDLDRVLVDVAGLINESLDDYSITYRDSTGTWDRIVVTPHDVLAHTFNVEVRPGPGPEPERRDPMATS